MRPSTRVRSSADLMACLGGTKSVSRRPSYLVRLTVGVAVLAGLGCGAWFWFCDPNAKDPTVVPTSGLWTTYAGVHFTPEPAFPDLSPPDVELIQVPDFPGAFAIWGAIGRAADGRIWFSAASHDVNVQQSAHLFEYNPETDVVTPNGDALSELKRVGLYRTGEQQVKIHTKILQGADGYLYFATTDDPPNRDTELLPKWGGHLWRYKPGAEGWEHLLSVPEGFIALAGNGVLMYGLLSAPKGWSAKAPFLYGCTTRDDTGDFYLVGGFRREKGRPVPIVLRLRPGA